MGWGWSIACSVSLPCLWPVVVDLGLHQMDVLGAWCLVSVHAAS